MYWDCHSHPQFSAYDADREEMLSRMKEAGVKTIAVGTNLEGSRRALQLAEQHADLVPGVSVGVHPTEFNEQGVEIDYGTLRELADNPRVVAVGECGFDFFHADRDEVFERQRVGLVEQINIAQERNLPLMIHCRDAFDDLIPVLQKYYENEDTPPIIVHFFTGTASEVEQLLELGAYFTFGGVVTFTNDYDEQIKKVPIERILSETDAPFVAPEPNRGKRNEPAWVVHVVPRLAELKGLSEEAMKERVAESAKNVFNI